MDRDRLPTWLVIWAVLTWPGALYLVLRIVWEETLLTWRDGPQMVGFSLAHTGPLILLLLSLGLAAVWLAVVLLRSVVLLRRHRPVSTRRWILLACGTILVSLIFVPYGLWQRLGVGSVAKGPHAAESLTYAAATGDLATVKALLRHGVGVNSTNVDGSTALHGAAVEGRTDVIAYLLTQGADVNIKNNFGRTPLDNAREMNRSATVRYLTEHGAN